MLICTTETTNRFTELEPANLDSITPHLFPGALLIAATREETNKQMNTVTGNL